MTPHIICPHCHCPIDPLTLEVVVCTDEALYRICPECDEPIVLSVSSEDEHEDNGEMLLAPLVDVPPTAFSVESVLL